MYRSGDRPGDWAQIRAACEWIDRAALPWRVPSGNMQSWFLMRLRTLPGERPARSDPVVFEVALPPGSKDDRPLVSASLHAVTFDTIWSSKVRAIHSSRARLRL